LIAEAAAESAARLIATAINDGGRAVPVVATGRSQLDFPDALVQRHGIDWARTVLFQLDEYVGLPPRHPGSLAENIRRNLIDRVHPGEVYHFAENQKSSLCVDNNSRAEV